MTDEERARYVKEAYHRTINRLEDTAHYARMVDSCMTAVIGAAALLGRDPVALSEMLRDGQLAKYLEAAETTLPLPFDDPSPAREPLEQLLRTTADWIERERQRVEKQCERILEQYDLVASHLRQQVQWSESWERMWHNLQFELVEGWQYPWEREEENGRDLTVRRRGVRSTDG